MWSGQSLLPGSICDMVAPGSSPPIRSPTSVPLQREPSRSLVASHSSLFRLKVFIRRTLACVSRDIPPHSGTPRLSQQNVRARVEPSCSAISTTGGTDGARSGSDT